MGNNPAKMMQTPASQSRMKVFSDVDVPEHLICSLCWEIFQDPVTTRCGHTFCKNCICACLDKQSECPLDRCSVAKRDLVENKALGSLCNQLIKEAISLAKAAVNAQNTPAEPTKNKCPSNLKTIFPDVASIHLMCHFHGGVLAEPVLLRCGHSMCRRCLELQFRKGAWRCFCRRKINARDPIPNRNAADFISDTPLRCRFGMCRTSDEHTYSVDHEGCQTLLKETERREHESTCHFVKVLCPCNESCRPIRKIHLESHIEAHACESATSNQDESLITRKWSFLSSRNKSISKLKLQTTTSEILQLQLHCNDESNSASSDESFRRLMKQQQQQQQQQQSEEPTQLPKSRPTSRDIRLMNPEIPTNYSDTIQEDACVDKECEESMAMSDDLVVNGNRALHLSRTSCGSLYEETIVIEAGTRDVLCSL
eukprot:TRINITY_DN7194_c0_g1_i2.p1 TRINITY_DN7194_c0_g1~~TRINITY_DN7194_c0_g1_i2.p1  ORF type:complete len:426 (+),score=77.70 TRINITY_DN7194_c0_g1_i2:52-1329(+)